MSSRFDINIDKEMMPVHPRFKWDSTGGLGVEFDVYFDITGNREFVRWRELTPELKELASLIAFKHFMRPLHFMGEESPSNKEMDFRKVRFWHEVVSFKSAEDVFWSRLRQDLSPAVIEEIKKKFKIEASFK